MDLRNLFIRTFNHKLPVVIIASGRGERMSAFTGNLFPKILCTIGQETLFDRILKNIEPICSELHIVGTARDNNILQQWYLKNCKSKFRIYFTNHNEANGSWLAIKHFQQEHPEIKQCILHWSDITMPFGKIPMLNESKNEVIVYASSKPRKCRFGMYRNLIMEGCDSENVFGIYQCSNLYNLVHKTNDTALQPVDLANILQDNQCSRIKLKRFIVPDSSILDNGDIIKHTEIMNRANNAVRYFNTISIEKDRVVKMAVNSRGAEVMANEIAFYTQLKPYCGTFLPRIYRAEANESHAYISMERIHGSTVHERIVELNKRYPHSPGMITEVDRIIEAVFKTLDTLHSIKVMGLCGRDQCMVSEYYESVFSRINEISQIIPDTVDAQCLLKAFYICPSVINPPCIEKRIDTTKEYLNNIMQRWKEILNKTYTRLAVIHGDPNSKNMMVADEDNRIVLIDPRGKFGKPGIMGDVTYDFAKFMYGLHSYSHFNHEPVVKIQTKWISNTNVCQFDMTLFIDHFLSELMQFVYPYHNAVTDEQKDTVFYWYTALIGIIYLKLTGYIKNDPTKALHAYMYGIYLLETAIPKLEAVYQKHTIINLFFEK